MAQHDEVYDHARAERLAALLRSLAGRILELDREGRLLASAGELQRLLGDVRSELFHYEARCTYDTPEIAESRRIVEEAISGASFLDDEDEEPWRKPTDE